MWFIAAFSAAAAADICTIITEPAVPLNQPIGAKEESAPFPFEQIKLGRSLKQALDAAEGDEYVKSEETFHLSFGLIYKIADFASNPLSLMI